MKPPPTHSTWRNCCLVSVNIRAVFPMGILQRSLMVPPLPRWNTDWSQLTNVSASGQLYCSICFCRLVVAEPLPLLVACPVLEPMKCAGWSRLCVALRKKLHGSLKLMFMAQKAFVLGLGWTIWIPSSETFYKYYQLSLLSS